ncbi:MAG: L-carnitine dehydrogenase [Alphaproteobacteria bacterium]|nr:L-carnitine dehydrogenase [Alphaproteobacteria bacterium]MDP6567937.1 L-carnitine dehydrogenase [Alphaproteobacteria bacterium]MDP6812347.1 L-carnitine dehydrogenase [Alphaproteobacteria bacterium]
MGDIGRVGLVGTGVIGAGWAARFLHHGIDVVATDPAPGAEAMLHEMLANAAAALNKLPTGVAAGRLEFSDDLERAVAEVDFIQESAPEREDLKRDLLARISRAARPGAIIASSSSGLLPSRLQADCVGPERVLIGHPFNPVYLLPLVEVVGGKRTSAEALGRAEAFYGAIGMHPLRVRREIEGYISDRLQEALWREALHLVNDGIATTEEIDRAIVHGPGLRWAFLGACLGFHLAGGAGGMRHTLEQFGPALQLPWTRLAAPELTNALADRLIAGTEAQAGGRSVRELERQRDDCLIAIMRAIEDAGAVQA